MGIQGLLPVLKSITVQVQVAEYSGKKVAVDAYCWLHKGAYCCAQELCEGTPTDKYVDFCMGRVELLRRNGVIPLIVFDGGRLPMKAGEEGARQRGRDEAKGRAAEHLRLGNSQAAYECFQKAVDISPAVANRFVQALKRCGVEFIVAPYEADAQMAYLALNGLVAAVLTEDSDLLPYGCPRVLFKMDKLGACQQVKLEDLVLNRDISFVGFTAQMFLEMCILAGCDFVKALSGIGVRKAHQHVKRLRDFLRVCKNLRFSGISVPRDYEQQFQRAIWTFHHQRVWCPRRRQLIHLRDLPECGLLHGAHVPTALPSDCQDPLDFLGPELEQEVAQGIAEGEMALPYTDGHGGSLHASAVVTSASGVLDPISHQPFARVEPVVQRCTSGAGSRPAGQQRTSTAAAGSALQRANSISNYLVKLAPGSAEAREHFAPPRRAQQALTGSGVAKSKASPARKAAQHPSGCGSQPEEVLAPALASFAAGGASGKLQGKAGQPGSGGQSGPAQGLQASSSCRPRALPQPAAAASRSRQDMPAQALDGMPAGGSLGRQSQEQQTPAEAASAPPEQTPAAGASWGSTGPSQGKRMTSRFFQPAAKRARSSSEGPEGAGQPQRRSASLPSNAEAQEASGCRPSLPAATADRSPWVVPTTPEEAGPLQGRLELPIRVDWSATAPPAESEGVRYDSPSPAGLRDSDTALPTNPGLDAEAGSGGQGSMSSLAHLASYAMLASKALDSVEAGSRRGSAPQQVHPALRKPFTRPRASIQPARSSPCKGTPFSRFACRRAPKSTKAS